jgi:hypothetical protein
MRTNYFINGREEPVAAVLGKRQEMRICKLESEALEFESDDSVVSHVLDVDATKPASVCKQELHSNAPKGKKACNKPHPRKNYTQSKDHKPRPSNQRQRIKSPEDETPGPGWQFENNWWVSPGLEIEFTLIEACKFEAFRVEFGGNEFEAYAKYAKYFGPLTKHPNYCVETSRKKMQPVKSEGDSNSLTSEVESEYRELWDYYLNQKVRKEEEIPSGMVIRKKVAQCQLLRSKSQFRRLVHKRILALNKVNEKREIYRILKEVCLAYSNTS